MRESEEEEDQGAVVEGGQGRGRSLSIACRDKREEGVTYKVLPRVRGRVEGGMEGNRARPGHAMGWKGSPIRIHGGGCITITINPTA